MCMGLVVNNGMQALGEHLYRPDMRYGCRRSRSQGDLTCDDSCGVLLFTDSD